MGFAHAANVVYNSAVGTGLPNITLLPMGHAACGLLPFQMEGHHRVAVIVRATFLMVPGRAAILTRPKPLVVADVFAGKEPAAASDVVPYRPFADVVLVGLARTPMDKPAPWLGVRLLVGRGEQALLDKRLFVRGPVNPAKNPAEPAPFASVPLSHVHANPTPENPAAVESAGFGTGGSGWPRLLDVWRRPAAFGMGPIPANWPSRVRLLGNEPVPKLELSSPNQGSEHTSSFAPTQSAQLVTGTLSNLPRSFPWAYFQAAPEDQRIPYLQGDEWIRLEGMHSQIPRVDTYLPGAYAVARLRSNVPERNVNDNIPLHADTLAIDAERMTISVVWRGNVAVPDATTRWSILVSSGVREQGISSPVRPSQPPPPSEGDDASSIENAALQSASLSLYGSGGRSAEREVGVEQTLDAEPPTGRPEWVTPFEGPQVIAQVIAQASEPPPHTLDFSDEVPFSSRSGLPFAGGTPASVRAPNVHLPPATPFDRVASSMENNGVAAADADLFGAAATDTVRHSLMLASGPARSAEAFPQSQSPAVDTRPFVHEATTNQGHTKAEANATEPPSSDVSFGPLGAFFLSAFHDISLLAEQATAQATGRAAENQ